MKVEIREITDYSASINNVRGCLVIWGDNQSLYSLGNMITFSETKKKYSYSEETIIDNVCKDINEYEMAFILFNLDDMEQLDIDYISSVSRKSNSYVICVCIERAVQNRELDLNQYMDSSNTLWVSSIVGERSNLPLVIMPRVIFMIMKSVSSADVSITLDEIKRFINGCNNKIVYCESFDEEELVSSVIQQLEDHGWKEEFRQSESSLVIILGDFSLIESNDLFLKLVENNMISEYSFYSYIHTEDEIKRILILG